MTPEDVKNILNFTFDRLEIPRKAEDGDVIDFIKVDFMHKLLEIMAKYSIIISKAELIEIVRACADASELLSGEQR